MIRYRSPDEDSGRWTRFGPRDGDVVVSTRSKHGTTWMQMICALLVHGPPPFPEPLHQLSPWLDWRGEQIDDVLARLDAQPHRRIVKTHTPLDGIPLDDRVRYVVVARDPLDAAVSLFHQGSNLDRERIAELTGVPSRSDRRGDLQDWLSAWIEQDARPATDLDSLPGVLHHLGDAWDRRDAANVLLVHYDDLRADLGGELDRVAAHLDVVVPPGDRDALARLASIDAMRSRAADLAPDRGGVFIDPSRFFRSGTSGEGGRLAGPEGRAAYEERLRRLAAPELIDWLHRPR